MPKKPDRKAGKSEDPPLGKAQPDDLPPAGPHAEPALTNPDAGTGALTPPASTTTSIPRAAERLQEIAR